MGAGLRVLRGARAAIAKFISILFSSVAVYNFKRIKKKKRIMILFFLFG